MSKPPYIFEVKKLWGDRIGIAFYPFILVTDKSNEILVKHELVHIEQQLKGWLVGFYLKYLWYQIWYGYVDNPYEVEARARSHDA